MNSLTKFLIKQIESEMITLHMIKNDHSISFKAKCVILGKAYGYLNALKQIAQEKNPNFLRKHHRWCMKNIFGLKGAR